MKSLIRISSVLEEQNGYNGMLEYYQQVGDEDDPKKPIFDPIERKYDLDVIADEIDRRLDREELDDLKQYGYHMDFDKIRSLPEKKRRSVIRARAKDELRQYEASNELASLTKKDFSRVMGNLSLIYNTDMEEIERQVSLINLISKHVISEYIRIDGLERLFSEQYIDFEWEMHLGMDHTKQRMKFYRDHFIHQVRDAYMMDRLLKDGGFYKKTREVLGDPSASKVSQFFCKMVKRQKRRLKGLTHWKYLRFDEDFIQRNIIYMAAYMAGLFHDIGYPETYLQSLKRRIRAYMPNMHGENLSTLPNGLFSLLQNSLLFRVVPYSEIEKRVLSKNIDHGTLSAVAFLLHFYENGVIFQLEPYKAAAVEMAALAIYNHTYVYSFAEPKAQKPNDYRPRFYTNPISYLLRVCDDLQEWDRVYFEISARSNILTCNRCNTPVIGQKRPYYIQVGNDKKRLSSVRRYVCNCCEKDADQGIFSRTFDGESAFPYRRLYNIQVCDWVEVCSLTKNVVTSDIVELSDAKDILLHVHYDPYRLLNIAFISPGYARYRVDELNKLKPLLMQQREISRMWLDYFVTANPILIKTVLLEEYLEFCRACEDVSKIPGRTEIYSAVDQWIAECDRDMTADARKAWYGRFDEMAQKLLTILEPQLQDCCSGEELKQRLIYNQVCFAVELYIKLHLYHRICQRIIHHDQTLQKITADIVYRIVERFAAVSISVSCEFECLLGDALLQLSRSYGRDCLVEQKEGIPRDYLQQFSPGNWQEALTGQESPRCSRKFYHTAIERYTDQKRYKPLTWKVDAEAGAQLVEIDAFTDLGFFQKLHWHMQEEKFRKL